MLALYIYCYFGDRLPCVYQDFRLKTNLDYECLAYASWNDITERKADPYKTFNWSIFVCLPHTIKKKIKSEHLSLPLHFNLRRINDHPIALYTSFTNNLLAISDHLYCWFYNFKRKQSLTMFLLHVIWLLSPALKIRLKQTKDCLILDYCSSIIMLQTFTTHTLLFQNKLQQCQVRQSVQKPLQCYKFLNTFPLHLPCTD